MTMIFVTIIVDTFSSSVQKKSKIYFGSTKPPFEFTLMHVVVISRGFYRLCTYILGISNSAVLIANIVLRVR